MDTSPALGPPAGLRLVRVVVPLRSPHVWAGGSAAERDVVLVRWTRPDGVVGWGECPTLEGYVTGGSGAAWDAAVAAAPQWVAGAPVVAPEVPVAVRGALADAALDADLRAEGRSLREALGATSRTVRRGAVVARPAATVDELVAAAVAAVADGAALVKIKVGPTTPVAVVHAVHDAVAPVPVAVDANGTLDLAAARTLDGLGLAYLEDPVAVPGGWGPLAAAMAGFATPWAVDEPVTSPADVDGLLAATTSAVDVVPPVVSLKPSRLGGVRVAADVARGVVAEGGRCVVGGMVELGVHRAAAVALAAAVADLPGTFPTDLGPSSRYVETDVAGPVVADAEGRLVVPDGPGCGVVPDPGALERFTVAVHDVG